MKRPQLRTLIHITTIILVSAIFPFTASAQISLDLGGYMQTWYIASETNEILENDSETFPDLKENTVHTQGFRIRRARLTARGSLNETFSATTWVEFSGSSAQLLDFYINANIKPWFNVRFGQMMMAGQTYNTSRTPSSTLMFYERPLITGSVSSAMGFSAFRDIGVMVHGSYGRLWYGVHAGNGTGRFQQSGTNITERDTGGGLYGARIDYELIDGVTIGGHLSTNQQRNVVQNNTGPFDIDRTSYSTRFATDGFGVKNLFTQFEYTYLKGNDERITVDDADSYKLHGLYAVAGYKLSKEWLVLGRYDEIVEKDGVTQSAFDGPRTATNHFTFGLSRLIFHNEKEIARTHLNYSFGESGPANLEHSALVLVFQVRFIP
jgi:hypothetical protein